MSGDGTNALGAVIGTAAVVAVAILVGMVLVVVAAVGMLLVALVAAVRFIGHQRALAADARAQEAAATAAHERQLAELQRVAQLGSQRLDAIALEELQRRQLRR